MTQDTLGKFDSGVTESQTAVRTGFRGIRRLRERQLLRRERLHRVLNILGFLPEHYANQIDFEKRLGQFVPMTEPKLVYKINPDTGKGDFLFKNSFNEMVAEFKQVHPTLFENEKGKEISIPYDWTIYYLRKKALTQKISKEELAWLLLNFNQKRGYYQLRGEEEEENSNKLVEFYALQVVDVQDSGDKKGKDEIWYNVILENGWIYRRTSKIPLDWIGKMKEFIVTTDLNEDGTVKINKDGKEVRSFRAPGENDWTLVKKKTEFDIAKSHKTVGAYIYDAILEKPTQKINGMLVRVVERKFYKDELSQILETQQREHPELQNAELYKACLEELYAYNDSHKRNIGQKDFVNLFLNDIIFYQRPLKSKKSLISNCKFETRSFMKDGKLESEPLKCVSRSHPLFQELRIWKFVNDLKIYQKGNREDINVTNKFIKNGDDFIALFDWFSERKEVEQKDILKYFGLKKDAENYRWNYVEDKKYPCNETRAQITSRLAKVKVVPEDFLNKATEEELWHILYSVTDKIQIEAALKTFAKKKGLSDDFAEVFKKFPPFPSDYGSYSLKAIRKILPLMRAGKYWDETLIHPQTMDRIGKIISGEFDETIQTRVREKAIQLTETHHFQGLPEWLASYIVYNRHSEDADAKKWKTANDIESLELHSLRNPIVEQVINETLKVVQDIWKQFGQGQENFFDEIHIELGREMKNPADKRKEMTNKINENENTNLRIKYLLAELANDPEFENVRAYSPTQQEILRIYEEGVLSAEQNRIPEDIADIIKMKLPTSADLTRYKLWLQQKYRSPYTGKMIPLNKLFTRAYDIEHIIPQSRYFDDSLSNKVICEVEINMDKGNAMAYEYIQNNSGKKVELSNGKEVTLFTIEAFEDFVKETYSNSRGKMKKLLMDEIPQAFVERQLNDSRYISKVVKNLMSNIVREENELETISKNVVVCTGGITSILKQDWGLNDVWNDIITPRFERLNTLTNSTNFGEWTNKDGNRVFQTMVPLQLQKGFSKKRIDHRHHALDAIVIACASRNHINYLNNENALGKKTQEEKAKKRNDLKHVLCFKKYNDDSKQNYKWVFFKPWDTFTQDTRENLQQIVVSFKQNLRVINKTVNQYQVWREDETGTAKKVLVKQTQGENWAVRKPMHKDTVSGSVKLQTIKTVQLSAALDQWEMIVDKAVRKQIKELIAHKYDKKTLQKFFKDRNNKWDGKDISKLDIYFWDNENVATRTKVDENFNSAWIASITDSGIRKIMLAHLEKYNEDKNGKIVEHPELAFSPDGVDEMNRNIKELNSGKHHHPILKVRTFEPKGNKFSVGQTGNKKDKYVEAAKGTNLFFAIYEDKDGNRSYDTIPLNLVVERQKQGLIPVPETKGDSKIFAYLSPNDLVYIPAEHDIDEIRIHLSTNPTKNEVHRIYKFVSCTEGEGHFVPYYYAKEIVKNEMGTNNKSQNSLEGIQIKSKCIKLKVDRLGNIRPA